MQLTSPTFLFLFLPLALLVHQAVPGRLRSWVLLLFSGFFYVWGEQGYVQVLCVTIVFNYFFALFMERYQGRFHEALFWGGVTLNLLFLCWFKYVVFFAGLLSNSLGVSLPCAKDNLVVHLPLGISFFTFLAISYLADVRNGVCTASRSFKDIALYFSFFPKVTAGPLIRYNDFPESLNQSSLISDHCAEGVRRFIIGLARKVLIATPLMKAADSIFSAPVALVDLPTAWLGALIFALQIYHDFAGYSDMAIGLGMMFGYRLSENFEYPYTSLSFTEFWRRWHSTLSGWLRDYLFYPLNRALITERFRERLAGGKTTMLPLTCVSLCSTFVVCGIWHGVGWNFVAWGLIHGLFLSFEQTAMGKRLAKSPIAMRRAYFLTAVALTWVLFRIESLRGIIFYLRAMVVPILLPTVPSVWTTELSVALVLALLFSFPVMEKTALFIPEKWYQYLLTPAYLLLFVITLAAVAGGSFNPFIYARF